MTTTIATAYWQRLDTTGRDTCRLRRRDDGWLLAGTALFDHDGEPCALTYTVACDHQWRTRSARVEGWIAARDVALEVVREETGQWRLNGGLQSRPAGCIDVDLGFTPATNLLAIRRLDLAIGAAAPAPAAYLDFPKLTLDRLEQRYRRLDATRFDYRSPHHGYAAVLEVSPAGFVIDYPGLWRGAVTL